MGLYYETLFSSQLPCWPTENKGYYRMGECCDDKQDDMETTARRHRGVLWAVLLINLAMFVVEMTTGLLSGSVALIGDSLDMLGDAAVYTTSLLVVTLGRIEKARVARFKAWIMLIFGLGVSVKCIFRAFNPEIPDFMWMLSVGGLALIANLICLKLLTSHREDDINMRSVWICSRNDIVANLAVLVSAIAVYQTSSGYPDVLVGISLAVLFARSALGILKDANTIELEKI